VEYAICIIGYGGMDGLDAHAQSTHLGLLLAFARQFHA